MNAKSEKRKFQFSLRGMFLATTFVSAGFALIALWLQQLRSARELHTNGAELLWILGPFAVFALLGAGIGALRGDAMKGAEDGVMAGIVVFFIGALSVTAVAAILPIILWLFA